MLPSLIPAMLGAYGVGVVATLSPCVYPILPITLGYFGTQLERGGRSSILLFCIGQWLALVLLGALMVFLGETLGFTADIWWVKAAVGLLLIGFAAISFWERMPAFLNSLGQITSKLAIVRRRSSATGALFLGVSSAAVLSPCTTPLLGSVLTQAMTQPSPYLGLLIMTFYALGFSSLFFLLGLGVLNIKKMPRSGRWLVWLHHTASLVMLLFGLYQLGSAVAERFWGIYIF